MHCRIRFPVSCGSRRSPWRSGIFVAVALFLAGLLTGCYGHTRYPRTTPELPFALVPGVQAPEPEPEPAPPPPPPLVESRPSPEMEAQERVTERARIEIALGMETGELERQWRDAFTLISGDQIDINVYGHPPLSGSVTITPDGRCAPPGLAPFNAVGRTMSELEMLLYQAYETAGVRDPRFSAALKGVAARYVTVVGVSSTRVAIQGQGTILETLAQAGWKPSASMPNLTLLRKGRQVSLNLKQLLSLRDAHLNLRLQADDVLVLKDTAPLRVSGEVQNPGEVMIPERGFLTAREVLMASGGVNDGADLTRAILVRSDGGEGTVNLNGALFGKDPMQVRFGPGDMLFIPQTGEVSVYVFGMVKNPGLVVGRAPFTYSQALALADPERFGAVLSHTRLVRGYPDHPEVLTISADRLFAGGDMTHDPQLERGDVIYVPESGTSDTLDLLSRIFGPINGTTQVIMGTQAVRGGEKALRGAKK